jgi:hypothetical protein
MKNCSRDRKCIYYMPGLYNRCISARIKLHQRNETCAELALGEPAMKFIAAI